MKAKGGDFLLKNSEGQKYIFSEDFNEEQKMIRDTVRSFVEQEILPLTDRIEKLEEGLIPSLMEQFAQLGLFGTHMPEEYGGSNMDYITNSIIGEEIGPAGSFSVSYNAHTGIGMLPILYYGTEEQKQKYLPSLIDGSIKASYCLTEPSSGSDALAAKSTATLSDDKSYYILNGQKMWITNAGFADLFTVFAQVDGDKFTAFLLTKGMPGLTLGAEEKKLGIKGSSTRMVFMENVHVPLENVLGEVGKGHLIAFNVLNTGRYKLGDSCLGGCKKLSTAAIKYANEREQFKVPIGSFGAIKYKIAEQVIRTYTLDASVYRTASLIQDAEQAFKTEGMSFGDAKKEAAEEYAIECSIIKVLGSEVLDYVVDETVQIHGGMGYSEEGNIARGYRDSRINRIFEGTNEVNRLIILNTIMRRAVKGEFDLMTPGMAVQNELMNGVPSDETFEGKYAEELKAISNYKKALIMLLGTAAQMTMSNTLNLKKEQEILMNFADIIIDIFALESTVVRAGQHSFDDVEKQKVIDAIVKTLAHDTNGKVVSNATDAIASFIEPSMQPMFISGLRKFTKYPLQNVKENRRLIADFTLKAGEYVL